MPNPSATIPVLDVQQLKKTVANRILVDNVSFTIYPGEIFGFLGPNGAGKTTTIRMLVGLIRPTAGTISINGYDIRKQRRPAMQNIGCIVENPDLYPYLTGYENLLQLGRMQGQEAVRRIPGVVDMVHLTDRIHDRVATYSLGMKQRLGIAQALLNQPKLLILDEPTNGLDPAGIRELRDFLRELAQGGMAVFISSHLLSEIELLCDSVAFIQNGRVVRSGRIDALLRQAQNDSNLGSDVNVIWSVEPIEAAINVFTSLNISARMQQGSVWTKMPEAKIPELTQSLVKHECRLFQVTIKLPTLEDVFLQTTGGASR